MGYETLLMEKEGMVAVLTLNRPPMNSVSYKLLEEMDAALTAVASDNDVRVLVITGAGDRSFCAGMDVADAPGHPDIGEKGRALWTRVDRFDKPVIAALNGHALGGGCELALACHFRFMADNPKALIGCPEVNLGIIPGWGGTQRLTRQLGRSKALELMLMVKRLNPQEALAIGLVDRVVPPGELIKLAKETAHALSERAPLAVRSVLRAVLAHVDKGIEAGFAAEAEGSSICAASKDAAEGFTSFFEKRKPNFKGE